MNYSSKKESITFFGSFYNTQYIRVQSLVYFLFQYNQVTCCYRSSNRIKGRSLILRLPHQAINGAVQHRKRLIVIYHIYD